MGKRPSVRAGKNILLKNVPLDVQSILISKVNDDSEDCQCIRNQEHSFFKIIREWHKINAGSMVISFEGRMFSPESYDVSFEGSDVVIKIKAPITSSLGAGLNYKRIHESR